MLSVRKGTGQCDLILSLRAKRSNLSLIKKRKKLHICRIKAKHILFGFNLVPIKPLAMIWCSYISTIVLHGNTIQL
ncbi:MAG: hypothetical protein U0586_08355 [Candidatus Brocadiaceae bacterium]